MTTTFSGKRWVRKYGDTLLSGKYPPLIENAIHATGNQNVAHFLSPLYSRDSHAPTLFRDMAKATAIIQAAIANNESIVAVTDYDVDGQMSCVQLCAVLSKLGSTNHRFYVPDRFTEGYGFSPAMVDKFSIEGVNLIITADIGITAHEACRKAKEAGIAVIILDHHLPDGEDVPDTDAVICPKGSAGLTYPNKDLCAAGVTLKLCENLLEGHPGKEKLLGSFLKLAALATVADMVNLGSLENRAIVVSGLQALSKSCPNPGLATLLSLCGLDDKALTASDVGFKIGPRINAAGRIAHADLVMTMFFGEKVEAQNAALGLDRLNTERQQIQEELTNRVIAELPLNLPKILLVGGEEAAGYHKGVNGLIANRLVEKTRRPAFVYVQSADGNVTGSARGIRGFHVVEAMDAASHCLTKFGGHPAAGGFSLRAERLEDFRDALQTYAELTLTPELLQGDISVADELTLDDLSVALVRQLEQLEPHGIGHAAPVIEVRGLRVSEIVVLKEKHLKLTLTDGQSTIKALWWNSIEFAPRLQPGAKLDVVTRLGINEWRGRVSVELNILDARN